MIHFHILHFILISFLPTLQAFDVQKSISLENSLQKESISKTLGGPQLITLPNGGVFASNCYIHSTSLTLKGQNHSSLRYHNDQQNDELDPPNCHSTKQSHEMNHLFQIHNASLSALDVTFQPRTKKVCGHP